MEAQPNETSDLVQPLSNLNQTTVDPAVIKSKTGRKKLSNTVESQLPDTNNEFKSPKPKNTPMQQQRKRKHAEIEEKGAVAVVVSQVQPAQMDNGLLHDVEVMTKTAPKKERKRLKNMAKLQDEANEVALIIRDEAKEADSISKKKKTKHHKPHLWTASEPVGGLFADLLPIFSPDEQHILLAQKSGIQIYAIETSMLVRTCRIGDSSVSSVSLSGSKSGHMFILLANGKLQFWNWMSGLKLKTWDLGAQVSDIAVGELGHPSETFDVVFTSEFRKGSASITAHHLREGSDPSVKCLYQQKEAIRTVKVLEHGKFIIATTANSVIIGASKLKKAATDVKELQYSFQVLKPNEVVTCADGRISTLQNSKKSQLGGLDIAIGLRDGSIRVYYDVLSESSNQQKQKTPFNQKLHWHREAVGSVAWALDGNYLLSGGRETVLISWQLDTGSQTSLPHLTSAIESIVVSPKKSSYAIRLADNSNMILATADLKPVFHIAGTSLPTTWSYEDSALMQSLPIRRTPVTSISSQPPRMLAAVPADTWHGGSKSGSYTNTNLLSVPLSTISVSTTKQALVDGNTTTIRRRPDGRQMVEPNVVLVQASSDGNWLACVDEWFRPREDLIADSVDDAEILRKQLQSVETNLVFWHWNRGTEVWEKSTSIANPHTSGGTSAELRSLVLDLISLPDKSTFWTLGSNRVVKKWTLRQRETIGSQTTTDTTGAQKIWRCARSICLPVETSRNDNAAPDIAQSARLMISKDESVLGITQLNTASSHLQLYAIQDTTMKLVMNIETQHRGVATALLGQYLVMADCESILVRNLIDSRDWYRASIGAANRLDLDTVPPMTVDHERQLFAISVPKKQKRQGESTKSRQSRVLIFSPASAGPVASIHHQPITAALLCTPSQKRFYALTTEAEISTIAQNLSVGLEYAQATLVEETTQPTNTLSNIFGPNGASVEARTQTVSSIEDVPPRKILAWEDLPNVNLEQPFALPKTSALQLMSVASIGA